jgi:AcrR family transcriptional regulator
VTVTAARQEATEAILDAAECLLINVGYAGITTRRLAERAGVNQGLVHYYFGSMQEVLLQAVERFSNRLAERQRSMYASDAPFIEKWRAAMRYLEEDAESGYQKILFELYALGWNDEAIRNRMKQVHQQWMNILLPSFEVGLTELGVDKEQYPVEVIVSLVVTFNEGIILERLSGIDSGHRQLLAMIERILAGTSNRR